MGPLWGRIKATSFGRGFFTDFPDSARKQEQSVREPRLAGYFFFWIVLVYGKKRAAGQCGSLLILKQFTFKI
jgi:hypothetical protein